MAKKAVGKPVRVRLKVKEVTEKQGHTRTWLSYHAQIQYDTVSRLWSKPETDAGITTLVKIARALRVDVSELYEVVNEE